MEGEGEDGLESPGAEPSKTTFAGWTSPRGTPKLKPRTGMVGGEKLPNTPDGVGGTKSE